MGSKQSFGLSHTILEIYKIGKVRKKEFEGAPVYDFYIRPDKEVIVMAPYERLGFKNNTTCGSYAFENIVAVRTSEDEKTEEMHQQGSKYKISMLYLVKKKNDLKEYSFYFESESDFHAAWRHFDDLNWKTRNEKERHLWVLLNPISGNKYSRTYYKNILKPMIDFQGLEHSIFETDSSTYVESFVDDIKSDDMPFTEFVIIGGDGLFSQLINAIYKRPKNDPLVTIPIGFIPGGSSNSLWWWLGGKNPYSAAINIIRGRTVKGDMFEAQILDKSVTRTVYATTMTYGFPSDLVVESQKLRSVFGKYRYMATGAKKFICSMRVPRYPSNVELNIADLGVEEGPVKEYQWKSFLVEQGDTDMKKETKPHNLSYEEIQQKEITTRGSIVYPKMRTDGLYHTLEDDVDGSWKSLQMDKFVFYIIVTHEAASSIENQSYVPFTRINDGSMYIMGLEKWTKYQVLRYMCVFAQGKHYKHHKILINEAKEFKISNPVGTKFWLDGEVFESNEVNLKVIPGALNLIGSVSPMNKEWLNFKQELKHK